MCSYDLTHGMLADYLALPPTNAAGQERRMVHAVRSAKQSAWLAFAKVRSGDGRALSRACTCCGGSVRLTPARYAGAWLQA